MALFYFKAIRYSSKTTRVAAVVQYLTREGASRPREIDGQWVHADCQYREACNLPAWARGDATVFFRASQQYERVQGLWATGWQMALPREVPRAEQIAMASTFLATHLEGKAYLWVLHDDPGAPQPHIHVLFSRRTDDGIPRSPVQYFARWNARDPERGGCQKDPWYKQRNSLGAIREAWADWTNFTLEAGGYPDRVYHRHIRHLGIARPAEPRMGWEKRPEVVAEITALRHQRDTRAEQAARQTAWGARKQELGITTAVPEDAQAFVQQGRTRARAKTPGRWQTSALPQGPQHEREHHALTVLARQAQHDLRTLETLLRGTRLARGKTHVLQGVTRDRARDAQEVIRGR